MTDLTAALARSALMLFLLACAGLPPAFVDTAASLPAPGHFVLAGATVVGLGVADIEVEGGKIIAVGEVSSEVTRYDLTGRWVTPAAIDSHVHLAYLPLIAEMAAGGVAAAVDLAAPVDFLAEDHAPMRIIAAGPMITAAGGYPTQGWGRNGYGREVTTAEEAAAAVDDLRALGAGVVKIPVDSGPTLSAEALAAAVGRAHTYGLRVASHALDDGEAAAARSAGIDVLAHTPVAPLEADTVAAWSGGAVVSTLGAFGGSNTTLSNLAALKAAGATVLYGTDFGNTRTPGVDGRELALLTEAGLTPAEVLAALTSAPAAYWGLTDLGAIEVGKAASVLVLPRDPLVDPTVLAEAEQVWLDGVRR